MSSLSRDSIITFFSSGVNFLIGILSSIVIARLVGPEGKGTYALVMLIPTMAYTVGNFGINQSVTYHIAREKNNRLKILSLGLKAAVAIGLILYLTLRFTMPWWHKYYITVPVELFQIALPLVFILVIYQFLEFALLGTGRVDLFNISIILGLLAGIAALGLAIVLPGDRLENITICSVSAPIIAILISSLFLWRSRSLTYNSEKSQVSARQFLTFGGITQITVISQFLSYRLDQFLLPAIIGTEALGIYTIAVALTERVWMISAAMQTSLMPRIPSSSKEAGVDITIRSLKHTIIITTIVVFGLASLGYFVIKLLFGAAFESAYVPMLIMLPGTYFIAIWKILGTFFISTNRPKFNAVIAVISMPINLCLNLILIPRLGIIGAAASSSFSYCITGLLVIYLFRRTTGLGLKEILVPGSSEFQDYRRMAVRLLDKINISNK